jgi:CRP-like cAMP-binding protein
MGARRGGEVKVGERTPLLKLKLERVDVVDRVQSDPVLSQGAVLAALGERQVAVLRAGALYRYPDRAVLFQPGDEGTALLMVCSGEVRIYARRDADLVELATAKAGDVVGEDEALSGSARQSAAVAQGPVEVLSLPRESLVSLEPLRTFLLGVQSRRRAQRDELADFMNRW